MAKILYYCGTQSPKTVGSVTGALTARGHAIITCLDASRATQVIQAQDYAAVVIQLGPNDFNNHLETNALSVASMSKERHPQVPVIGISPYARTNATVNDFFARHRGEFDVMHRSAREPERLCDLIQRYLRPG